MPCFAICSTVWIFSDISCIAKIAKCNTVDPLFIHAVSVMLYGSVFCFCWYRRAVTLVVVSYYCSLFCFGLLLACSSVVAFRSYLWSFVIFLLLRSVQLSCCLSNSDTLCTSVAPFSCSLKQLDIFTLISICLLPSPWWCTKPVPHIFFRT